MAYFMFRFWFPELKGDSQEAVVECYGVQFTTPLKKSWQAVRQSDKYRAIKGLKPRSIFINTLKKKKPPGYLSWEQRQPRILTAQQVAAYQTMIY